MSKEELIKEATARGYLNAASIQPAHLSHSVDPIILNIPKGADFQYSHPYLYLRVDGNTSYRDNKANQSWAGVVYDCSINNKEKWAEIVSTHTPKDLVGRYIKVLNKNLGGHPSYEIGDYLKVLENPTEGRECHTVEKAGTLNLTYINNRVEKGDVELMPRGWAPSITLAEKSNLVGRYIKVIDDRTIKHYNVKNGDYLLFSHMSLGIEHWGDATLEYGYYFGTKAHSNPMFELMPVGWDPSMLECSEQYNKLVKLSNFPERGACYQPNDALLEYLKAREGTSAGSSTEKGYPYKILAWNHSSCWGCLDSTSQPEYHITQLEPFLINKRELPKAIPDHLLERPLTPEECFFPEKWCIKVTVENRKDLDKFYKDHINEYEGCYTNWEPGVNGYFHYPQERKGVHSATDEILRRGYTEITFEQFEKHVLNKKEYVPFSVRTGHRLPDLWYIKCDGGGPKTQAVKEWANDNNLNPRKYSFNSFGFSYYHFDKSGCLDHFEKAQPYYTEITFEQFNKYVLTHTDKKQINLNTKIEENGKSSEHNNNDYYSESKSCKVQGPNHSIRRGSEIRATGIRCTKVKIQIRSGHLPN